MDSYANYILVFLSLLCIILLFLLSTYLFLLKNKKNIQIDNSPALKNISIVYDMIFKLMQCIFIICVVLYSDVIKNYYESMKLNKKVDYYEIMSDVSIEETCRNQFNSYIVELKDNIKKSLKNNILLELMNTVNIKSKSILLPSVDKVLHDTVSYFYQKNLPPTIGKTVSKKISMIILDNLSKDGIVQAMIREELNEEMANIMDRIVKKQIVASNVDEFLFILNNVNFIVDQKIYSVDNTIRNYEQQVIDELSDYYHGLLKKRMLDENLDDK